VLTQRTEHIDALVAGLAVLGDDALVLRGGLGKRALLLDPWVRSERVK